MCSRYILGYINIAGIWSGEAMILQKNASYMYND